MLIHGDAVDGLNEDYDALVLYCRMAGRSSLAWELIINGRDDPDSPLPSLCFWKVYEIDRPDGASGYGGFSGPSYKDRYNGYAGFPRRLTDAEEFPCVSWTDSGLPVKRAVKQIPQTEP